MPLFHRKSEEERAREEESKRHFAEAQALQEASLDTLRRGGIPVQAQRRLDELRKEGGKLFTSDLSVNEFLLTRHLGLQAISQVMGSSIYHVGWQRTPGQYAWSHSQELQVVTDAMNAARALALGRLREEAQRVGADAVVGVHVRRGGYEWGEDLIEFNVLGTAVRVEAARGQGLPALTNLSGQDFWKLYQAGYWPVGVVAASSVYYVVASWQTQMAGSYWTRWFNQELGDFTRGVYLARHGAIGRVYDQAAQLGAGGVVGMEIEQEEEEHEVSLGNDQERTDMIFTFHVIGTAIREMPQGARRPAIRTAVNLRS